MVSGGVRKCLSAKRAEKFSDSAVIARKAELLLALQRE